jgi:small subunit ribosomal protein S18
MITKMNNNFLSKDKKKKKRINWSQRIESSKEKKSIKIKKSLYYILFLKKYENKINFKNIELLKAFLTKYGKIKPRRKTRISVQSQKQISKAIRRARVVGLIPFICNVTS